MIALSVSCAAAESSERGAYRNSAIFDIPDGIANRSGTLSHSEAESVNELTALGARQAAELNKHLQQILVYQPDAFGLEDLDNALDDLLKLAINLRRLEWLQGRFPPNTPQAQAASWSLVTPEDVGTPRDMAITALAKRAARKPGCELVDLQIADIPREFWLEFAIQKIVSERQTCHALPFDELHHLDTARLKRLRPYIGNEAYSFVHAELASRFPGSCTDPVLAPLERALRLCRWAKGRVDFGEKLPVARKDRFAHFPARKSGAGYLSKERAESVIRSAPSKGSAVAVARRIAALSDSEYWLSPDRTKLVFPVGVENPLRKREPEYLKNGRSDWDDFLAVVTNTSISFIAVPPTEWGQYGGGRMFAISDVDHDGNIEVWFSGEWGECDGEGLVPGRDCAVNNYYRLEQFGSDLSPFVAGSRPKP